MITLRVLPALIKLNHVIKLGALPKKEFFHSSRHSMRVLCPEAKNFIQFRTMSTDLDEELSDPKRHYDYKQLVEKKNQAGVVVIDVREHSEINATGKIPGSIHIPLGELHRAIGEMSPDDFKKQYNADLPNKNNEIIFSCKSGGRSLKALKTALQLGYSKAGNYKGGWMDWEANSGKSNN